MLDAAARPIGGLCARALRFRTAAGLAGGVLDLEELIIRHALGEDVSAARLEGPAENPGAAADGPALFI